MKILGRRPGNVLAGLLRVPEYVIGCLRCFGLFEHPLQVVLSYLVRRPPASGVVRLKNGWTIRLSSDPADIVTVVVVFARRDYGPIAPGSVVVDVGANIGVFSLYAAFCGARHVVAIEPSAESYACLERNVCENGLAGVIVPRRLAAASRERSFVRFARRSNVMNVMHVAGETGDLDEVATTTLDATLEPLARVDLVKLDCEGAEYEILFGAGRDALRNVSAVRLEYHQGRRDQLIECMARHGFAPAWLTADNAIGGVIWFCRATG